MSPEYERYQDLVDELRASRRVVGWKAQDDRTILADLEDLYGALTSAEQHQVNEEGWRGWPDLYDARVPSSGASLASLVPPHHPRGPRQGDTSSSKVRTRNLWLLIYPASDAEGELEDEWVAYCVDLDLVVRGESPSQAYEKGRAAVLAHFQHEVQSGLDPFRKTAPDRFWSRLRWVMSQGAYNADGESALKRFDDESVGEDGTEDDIFMLAMQVTLILTFPTPAVVHSPQPAWELPVSADHDGNQSNA